MHIGSQITDPMPYAEGARKLAAIVEEIRAAGVGTLESVDVGGGLGISYTGEAELPPEAFADAVAFLPRQTGLTLVTEPGRFLVGNAGSLLTRVLYRKRSGGREILVVDAGMNDLLRPSLYGAHHDIRVLEPVGNLEGSVDVVGPLCESGDFLGLDRTLAGAGVGALLEVRGAGAYGFSMSSQYNSRPRAAEVVVEGDRFALARRRETLDDLFRGESTDLDWSGS
jgi:diaminopimelate decarboxylase